MTDRRTIRGWVHYLEGPDVELTLSELMALCLLHIRENVMLGRLGTEHVEGMVGTLDAMLAETHPVYSALAGQRSRAAVPELR